MNGKSTIYNNEGYVRIREVIQGDTTDMQYASLIIIINGLLMLSSFVYPV